MKTIDAYAFKCQLDGLNRWPWKDGMLRLYPYQELHDPIDLETIKLVKVRVTIEVVSE